MTTSQVRTGTVETEVQVQDLNRPGPLTGLLEASHAKGDYYTGESWFEAERSKLFMKQWLFLGREEQYPDFGSYQTFRIVGEPVLICRDRDMQLHAFLNECPHRGVELVSGEGNAKRFVCPYHAWSFHLTGEMAAATFMEDSKGFDKNDCGLHELKLEIWQGCIFVCFDQDAAPLAEYLTDFAKDLAPLGVGDLELVSCRSYEFNCNWKLVVENIADFYHVGTLHKASIGKNFKEDAIEFSARQNGGFFMQFTSGPGLGEFVLGKNPAMKDLPDNFSGEAYLSPNLQANIRTDTLRITTCWPISVGKMRMQHYDLLPKLDHPDREVQLQKWYTLLNNTYEEDRQMIESLQRVQSSHWWVGGPMSKLEWGVHRIIGNIMGTCIAE